MQLGPPDASGRPRPVPVPGSEFVVPLDSLIVAVGEEPDADFLDQLPEMGAARGGAVVVSEETLATQRAGGVCRRRRGDRSEDRARRHGRRKAGCRNDRQASSRRGAASASTR